jgi:putative ABC transport system substrate-binding protein
MMRKLLLAAVMFGLASGPALSQNAPKKVGVLINGGPSPLYESIKKNFLTDFSRLGYAESDIIIEPRFAEGRLDRLPALAAELAAANADVIFALGGPSARAAQGATKTIPVVFSIVTDPVALGLVAAMDRPGANVTGLTSLDREQAKKQFELLKEMFPDIKRVAILSDKTIPGGDERGWAPIDRANDAAARSLGIEPQIVKLKDASEIEDAFAAMKDAEAVVVLEVPVPFVNRKMIAELARKNRLPAMFPGGQSDAGGLVTYGTSVTDTWRQLPSFADKIFKGAKPAEMPVEVSAKRELVFNLQTAQEVGVTIAPDTLKKADRTIQ